MKMLTVLAAAAGLLLGTAGCGSSKPSPSNNDAAAPEPTKQNYRATDPRSAM